MKWIRSITHRCAAIFQMRINLFCWNKMRLNCIWVVDHFTCRKRLKALKVIRFDPTTFYRLLIFSRFLLFLIVFTRTHITRTHTQACRTLLLTPSSEQCTQSKRTTWTVNRLSFVCTGFFISFVFLFFFFLAVVAIRSIKNTHVHYTYM